MSNNNNTIGTVLDLAWGKSGHMTAVAVVEACINAHPNGVSESKIANTLSALVDSGHVRKMPALGAVGYVRSHVRSINVGNRKTWGPAGNHVSISEIGIVRVNRESASETTLAERHAARRR